MKVTAAVAEFNLFHDGHARLLDAISNCDGDSAVKLAIMSGNFVQRGEPAVLDKYIRAEIAVKCGVDLVLELPFPWCCSGAEFFASGAISLLSDIARSDLDNEYRLCFGSENGSIDTVSEIVKNLSSEKYIERISEERRKKNDRSESDIRMRSRVYEECFGMSLPRTPNDILGVEYLRALSKEKDCSISAYTVKRNGDESATRSREYYRAGDMDSLERMCPSVVTKMAKQKHPVMTDDIYSMIASWLLLSSGSPSDDTDGMTRDLIYRFISAAKGCTGFNELIRKVSTKKYTDARLRRALILGFFGVKTEMLCRHPSFTVVLGASEKGRKLLASLRRAEDGPRIVTAPADAVDIDGSDLSFRADSLYAIASGLPPSSFMLCHPYIE